jgi:hypothetical protein
VNCGIITSELVKPVVQPIEGFVVNRSSVGFTAEQLQVLNNGLNYALHKIPNTEQIIIDTDTAVNNSQLPTEQKNTAKTIIQDTITQGIRKQRQNYTDTRIVKELKEKPVFYVKADKGNNIVILDKKDYDNIMTKKLTEGPYRKLRKDPLPDILKRFDKTIKDCKPIFLNFKQIKIF